MQQLQRWIRLPCRIDIVGACVGDLPCRHLQPGWRCVVHELHRVGFAGVLLLPWIGIKCGPALPRRHVQHWRRRAVQQLQRWLLVSPCIDVVDAY